MGNILVVDDTIANLRLLSSILSERGYVVRPAPSGALALKAIELSPPDLIILDVNMPDMNGFEVCARLKLQPETRGIPIIFVSAMGDIEDKIRAFRAGAVDYVTKPFQVEEVLARVDAHHTLRVLQKRLSQANHQLELQVAERTADLLAISRANERFVPREFLQMLGRNNITEVRLGDQIQREMTVLFTDILDFTSLAETMSPQETFSFINGYLGRVCPVIARHGGVIDKYVGDEIIALFPGRVDDAVGAAIELQRVLAAYSREREQKQRRAVRAWVGIHVGTLMVGMVGEAGRIQGTVISDAVNTASRLERLTRRYGCAILTSEQALQALHRRDAHHVRFVDCVLPRGKTAPLAIYEVFDGDDAETFEHKQRTLVPFEEGIELYRARRFPEACIRFAAVLEQNPRDGVARLYLERAADLMVHGIPETWQPIERLL